MVLFPALAFAFTLVSAPSFEELRAQALPLDRPAQAIAVLVGACDVGGGAVDGECLDNTRELKERVKGARVWLDLGARHETLLTFGKRLGAKARFVWTPLYDVGNGLALTVGRPQRLAPDGSIVVARKPVEGAADPDLTDLDLTRLCSTGQVGIQVVGRFGKPWALAAGEKSVRGLTFEVEGLRLYHARTGATLLESAQALR